ncbi:hypothetical protein PsYK624_171270 [Phanerochaete sordida]|uniref:Uncharacterized protein n=1 Tax=Phanerochaete sordida TaxID=48140 RepID=A0A9P3LP53_9APHY|nr:hypothetical protein PsYK624_171270 [Phanerochaete sordida]
MYNAFALFALPSTYRSLIALWGRLHRCWAECFAFVRWYMVMWYEALANPSAPVLLGDAVDVQTGLGRGIKGAFTTDPAVAQKLYAAGVPVWYIQPRHTIGDIQIEGRDPISFTEPYNILQDREDVRGDVRCRVRAGEQHLLAISKESEALLDIEHVALPVAFGLDDEEVMVEQNRGHKGKGKAAQRVLALERFKVQEHELLLARVTAWQEALSALDLTKPCEALVGLWFPEPELLVSPLSKVRLLTYISNWMSLRVPLFGRLGRPTLYAPVTQNSWRTLLSRFPEQSEEEKQTSEQHKALGGKSQHAVSSTANKEASSSSTLTLRSSTLASGSSAQTLGSSAQASRSSVQASSSSAQASSSFATASSATAKASTQAAKQEAAQKRHQQKEAVCRYFTAFLGFQRPLMLRTEPIKSFLWREVSVTLDTAAAQAGNMPVPANVVREIAWELGEVAFHAEVCELDVRMVPQSGPRALRLRHELLGNIFPGAHWSRPDFPRPLEALDAEAVRDRMLSLEGLRVLIRQWPGCPASLQTKGFRYGLEDAQLLELKRQVAQFYCQCAFQKFGRAAAIPRRLPGSLRVPTPQAQQALGDDAP